MRSALAILCILASLAGSLRQAGADPGSDAACRECDIKMRKVFEAVQAWRRKNNGAYPEGLADLSQHSQLIDPEGIICPKVLRELPQSSAKHSENSSRGEGKDPHNAYEYELSKTTQLVDEQLANYVPEGFTCSRRELKSELLRRPFAHQVPILRCPSHRSEAPAHIASPDSARRNLTITGQVYWSDTYWEFEFLDDVPYCARNLQAVLGLRGPPFNSGRPPQLPGALDLNRWTNAFGDHAWWWTVTHFETGPNRQLAASLKPFFAEDHGRTIEVGGEKFWIDGLVQLQGKILGGGENIFKASARKAFPEKRTGLAINRRIASASWLQATVWEAQSGETTGRLVFDYADGTSAEIPIIYGRDTARFWSDRIKPSPPPTWSAVETGAISDRDRQLHLFKQQWSNPWPEKIVRELSFFSDPSCPASPFVVAINVTAPE